MILLNPVLALLYLAGLAVDITMFFLGIHLIQRIKPISWLAPFEQTGQPLVHRVTITVETILRRWPGRQLSQTGKEFLGLGILCILKWFLNALLHLCIPNPG